MTTPNQQDEPRYDDPAYRKSVEDAWEAKTAIQYINIQDYPGRDWQTKVSKEKSYPHLQVPEFLWDHYHYRIAPQQPTERKTHECMICEMGEAAFGKALCESCKQSLIMSGKIPPEEVQPPSLAAKCSGCGKEIPKGYAWCNFACMSYYLTRQTTSRGFPNDHARKR